MGKGYMENLWGGFFGNTGEADIVAPDAYQAGSYSFLADPAYNDVTADLYDITQGTGQTVSERVGALESAKAQRSAASLMASQRGMNPALAAKLAGDQSSQIRGDMAGKIATGAMLERERGRQTLLNALEANRQARIDQERIQAGATGQANQNYIDAQKAQAGIDQYNQAAAGSFAGNVGSAIVSGYTGGGYGSSSGYSSPSQADIAYGGATPEGRSLPMGADQTPAQQAGIQNKAINPQLVNQMTTMAQLPSGGNGQVKPMQMIPSDGVGGIAGAMIQAYNNMAAQNNEKLQPAQQSVIQRPNVNVSTQTPSNMTSKGTIASQGFNPANIPQQDNPVYASQKPVGETGETPWKDPEPVTYQMLPMRYQDQRNNPGLQTFDTSNLPNRYKIDPVEIPYEVAQGDARRRFYQGLINNATQGGYMYTDGKPTWQKPTGNVNPEWEKIVNSYKGPSSKEWVEQYYAQKMRNKPQEVRNA
jgi:hypothetical protein